jgi:poly(hydroxyalkanoate) depolymerase family esterase
MNKQMRGGMFEATRLTRAGRLLEATAIIQRTLGGALPPDGPHESTNQAAGDVIEATFEVVEPATRGKERAAQEPNLRLSTAQEAKDSAGTAASPRPSWHGALPRAGAQWPGHKRGATQPPAARPVAQPEHTKSTGKPGGQFIDGSYSNQAGARSYKLYVPSAYHGQALPLVVMLHGCTQSPDDFAAGTHMNELAEEHGCLVVYPAQPPSANGSKCWNWFKAADQRRDQGEPSLIAGITRQIIGVYHVDAERVYVAGLSSGGAMAVIMGQTYPDLYAAVGCHSGLAYGVARDLPSALNAMRQGGAAQAGSRLGAAKSVAGAGSSPAAVPIIVFHGDQDSTVHPSNAEQIIGQWAGINRDSGRVNAAEAKPRVRVQPGQVPAGHAFTRAVYYDANDKAIMERWMVHGAGHAWSGGSARGSFTEPNGPDATREMLRFFLAHPRHER